MRLLDTPQWDGLTTAQKRIISNIYASDGPWVGHLSAGGRGEIEWLEELGLITVAWDIPGHGQVTIEISEEGWRHPCST
jgi:hypothetical protein